MTHTQIATMINSIGLPFAYYSFPEDEAPDLPYVVYYYPSSNDFAADNSNYVDVSNLNIELYTENKDFTAESLVESVLKQNYLFYDKYERYVESERMYQIVYQIQLIIKGE